MKFRYIFIDEDGDPAGTNDPELALHVAREGNALVIDVQDGLTAFGSPEIATELQEADKEVWGPEEEEDDEEDEEDSDD